MSERVRKTYEFPKELHDQILAFKESQDLPSESEAVRELVRRGIREEGLWRLAVLQETMTKKEIEKKHPEAVMALRLAMVDHISNFLERSDSDLVEAAGGIENLSKEEIEAIRRVSTGDLSVSVENLNLILSGVMPKVAEHGGGDVGLQRFASGIVSGMEDNQETLVRQ